MHKVIFFLFLSLAFCTSTRAQRRQPDDGPGPFSLRLHEADSASRVDGRPLFVYLYIKPCPACRSFEKGTLNAQAVRVRLSEAFRFAPLDARSMDRVSWRGVEYGFDGSIGTNAVVPLLAKGALSFPMSVIVSPDGKWHQAIPGDIGKEELSRLLDYASGGHWRRIGYDVFENPNAFRNK